jgi:hypothetical protein
MKYMRVKVSARKKWQFDQVLHNQIHVLQHLEHPLTPQIQNNQNDHAGGPSVRHEYLATDQWISGGIIMLFFWDFSRRSFLKIVLFVCTEKVCA